MPAELSMTLIFGFAFFTGAPEQTVLATTFPIYQIARNVTQGRDGVKVDLMMPSQQGCPHDYALTTQDMQKLAKANILVVNGLGMEDFLGAPAFPKVGNTDDPAIIQMVSAAKMDFLFIACPPQNMLMQMQKHLQQYIRDHRLSSLLRKCLQ